MKIAGIIAEYNPFHNGHLYQVQYIKKKLGADYVVAVMSGDFVQRGEPAILGKFLRTRMALEAGVDLVLEHPTDTCTGSAERFALGGVSMLHALGVVDWLCFGTETDKLSAIRYLADWILEENPNYLHVLRETCQQGKSYPEARMKAILQECPPPSNSLLTEETGQVVLGNFATETAEKTPDCSDKISPENWKKMVKNILTLPNNILALEYCKALQTCKSAMIPVAIPRVGTGHDTPIETNQLTASRSQETLYLSASGIRSHLKAMTRDAGENPSFSPENLSILSRSLPPASYDLLTEEARAGHLAWSDRLDILLRYRLWLEDEQSLGRWLDVSPDLAKRIYRLRGQCLGFESFCTLLHSKNTTDARLRRALLHLILSIPSAPPAPPCLRILGFRRESRPLLHHIRRHGASSMIAKPSNAMELLENNCIIPSSNIYNSIFNSHNIISNSKNYDDIRCSPVII